MAFIILAAVAGPSLVRRYQGHQAEKLLAAGESAWARGAVREALLNFTTARSLRPRDPRPLLREGQLRLRTGDREGARALFRPALAPGSPYYRALVAVTYHDALMGAGWWSELATLALEMLPRRDELHLLWLQSAVEAVRLAGWDEARLRAAGGAADAITPTEQAILLAAAAGRRDPDRLAQRLAAIPASLSVEESWLVARWWYRLGRPDEARRVRAHAPARLTPGDHLLDAVLAADEDAAIARHSLEQLVDQADSARGRENLLLALAQILGRADATLAEALSRRARPRADDYDHDLVAAIWIYCGLAQAGEEERFWRELLVRRTRRQVVALPARPLDAAIYAYLVGNLALRRELVSGLVAALPESAL